MKKTFIALLLILVLALAIPPTFSRSSTDKIEIPQYWKVEVCDWDKDLGVCADEKTQEVIFGIVHIYPKTGDAPVKTTILIIPGFNSADGILREEDARIFRSLRQNTEEYAGMYKEIIDETTKLDYNFEIGEESSSINCIITTDAEGELFDFTYTLINKFYKLKNVVKQGYPLDWKV